MLGFLLSGDGTVIVASSTRAQLPLLLAQASNVTSAELGLASEEDTALPVTALLSGAAIVQVGIATEDDLAPTITAIQTPDIFLPIGTAEETDEAFSVAFVASGGVFLEIGLAEETDEVFAITSTRTFLVSHNDRGLSLTPHVDADLTMTPVEVE